MAATKLAAFFTPAAIAVIGASTNPAKLGYAVVKNLVEGGFTKIGKLYPINPSATHILGINAFPSVSDVPD